MALTLNDNILECIKKEFRLRDVDQEANGETYNWIQFSTNYDDVPLKVMHYELIDNHVELHFEGETQKIPDEIKKLEEYLKQELKEPNYKWENWNKDGQKCQYIKELNDDNYKDVTKEFVETLDELIDEYEFDKQNSVRAKRKTIKQCLLRNLVIPNYQRPYRWTESNVEQLLSDIKENMNNGKIEYVVGSVILHVECCEINNKKTCVYNIVDGQQRITTLLLLLKCGDFNSLELNYDHCDSFYHIKKNKEFIDRWLDNNISDRGKYLTYVLENCQFVEVVVKDQHEAFQMFESQNGRGKELEPYNLLKAYHIRAMEENSEEERKNCDKRWESAVSDENERWKPKDLLLQLFGEQLYKSRLWTRGDDAIDFTKKNIGEFKGVTFSRGKGLEFAYQNILVQQEIASSFMRCMNSNIFPVISRFLAGDPENMSPYVNINQFIVNGKSFFDYVETYVEMYKRLFLSTTSQIAEFKEFYRKYCLDYNGAERSGDGYVREVYKSAIMMMFDKFGEKGVEMFYKDIYVCIYKKRLEMVQVRRESMKKIGSTAEVFKIIFQANTLGDLESIRKNAHKAKMDFVNKNGNKKECGKAEDVKAFFQQYQ